MVSSANVLLDAQFGADILCQFRGESGISIGDNSGWDPKVGEDLRVVDLGKIFGPHRFLTWYE